MKLGHLSDIHILDLGRPRLRSFLNKRLIGGANLLFHRSGRHSASVVEQALGRVEALGADHIAISGDLSNLALDSEFRAATTLLRSVADPERRVSVVPGNHDYYTYESARRRRFERYFEPFMRSDLPAYQQESAYPWCKLLDDDVALIGMNSAIPTPWFFATGRVSPDQLEATRALLDDPALRDRFKVVVIHHHLLPFEHSRSEHLRRLVNAPEVLEVLRYGRVDLAIHGHNHHFSTTELPHLRGSGVLRICEAGSTSVGTYDDPAFGGKFNLYHIEQGALQKIETHLFVGDPEGFVPWRERAFDVGLDHAR